jgi:hypothetical protein
VKTYPCGNRLVEGGAEKRESFTKRKLFLVKIVSKYPRRKK